MKSVVRRLFVNFEKEEKWLNDMAARGLNFIDYSFGRYLFEEGRPGEYIYRLELLNELPSHPESKEYIRFMEDAGIECVGSYARWVYFRKRAEEGPFNLYSDYESRIRHYKKVSNLVVVVLLVNLLAAMTNLIIGLKLGIEGRSYFNLYISVLSWTVVIVLTTLFISYQKKIRRMKKEKSVYE